MKAKAPTKRADRIVARGEHVDKPLDARQARFVEEYLIDLNATAAAIRAGYSEKSAKFTQNDLMRKPQIVAAIQAALDARSKRTKIDADYVLGKIRDTVEAVSTPGEGFDAMATFRGCELLGKHLKLFTDKVELSGKVATPVELSDEQLAAIAAAGRS